MLNAFGASMAGLFLLLALCVAVPAGSGGIWFELFRVTPPPPCCVEGNYLVVHMRPDNSVRVNLEPDDAAGAARLVSAKMERRFERAVYLSAEEGTTVQQVAGLAGDLASATENLHIGLMTNRQLNAISYTHGGRTFPNLEQLAWPYCPGLTLDHIPMLAGCK